MEFMMQDISQTNLLKKKTKPKIRFLVLVTKFFQFQYVLFLFGFTNENFLNMFPKI